MLSIRTNTSSLAAQRNLSNTQNQLDSSLGKLSSGYRITKAADDAAGLGISTNLNAQIKSYDQAGRNANDGLSVVQTAEAALTEVSNILTRMRELAMQAASDGVGSAERVYIQDEATKLTNEIDRINSVTEFNEGALFGASKTFQVGIRNSANDRIDVDMSAMDISSTGLQVDTGALDFGTLAGGQGAIDAIDDALDSVSSFRSQLGAAGNQLASAANFIKEATEAASAANSRIRDVDVASETSRLSASQVLMQAGVSMLAQANQAPQVALKLLG